MASLRDMVSEYQDDLRNGIAWLAFWREGRSWQAEAFHLDLDDTLYPEDRARLAEIQAADPRAVVVNGYYSGYLGEEMNVAELVAGVRHHYDNGLTILSHSWKLTATSCRRMYWRKHGKKPMLPDCLSMNAPTAGTTSTRTPMTAI